MSSSPAPTTSEQRISQVLKVFSEVASLVALITALLVYFGWRRSEAQARHFGADASVFGMSTQDYVLRSVEVVQMPAVLLLILCLLLGWLHRRVSRSQRAGTVGRVLQLSWLVPFVVGLPLLFLAEAVGIFLFPFLFATAVLGTWYGVHLRRAADGRPSITSVPLLLLLGTLTAVALFGMTERVARLNGDTRAEEIKNDVERILDEVAVFSAQDLRLEGDGVSASPLEAPPEADGFLHRYDGLYLLQHSGGKYFLITADWSDGHGRLVVLPDESGIRVEFGPGIDPGS